MTPLYISYLPGAGGKALINCLHCSDDVIINDVNILKYQTDQIEVDDIVLNRLLSTVPNSTESGFWSNHEIHNIVKGCDSREAPQKTSTDQLEKLQQLKGWLPLVTHYHQNWKCYRDWLGPGVTVGIKPDIRFIDTAIRIKWLRSDECPEPCLDILQLQEWEHDFKSINADIVIDNYDPLQESFFLSLEEIASKLNITLKWSLINQYIAKYRQYHFDAIERLGLKSYY